MLLISQTLFFVAFAAYLVAAVIYVVRLAGWGSKAEAPAPAPATGPGARSSAGVRKGVSADGDRLARTAFMLVYTGIAIHGLAMVIRWVVSGQAPMTNMYEYMSLTGWAAMLFFVLLNIKYNQPALGAFAAPIGVFVIAYGSVFSTKVQPLVPVLQSYWLVLHVTFAALGEGAFAVAFAAAIMYLLRMRAKQPLTLWEERGLEWIFASVAIMVGFVVTALAFKAAGYQVVLPQGDGGALEYKILALVGPAGAAPGSAGNIFGIPLPFFTAPEWMGGFAAARKFNTLVISLVAGCVIYWAVRLAFGRTWRDLLTRPVSDMSPEILDDISYRGIALGYPLFTIGAIVFGMVWAQKSWGSYWSWDPKETWSLISWLFYTGYLHLRIVKGWQGRPAAWTAAVGFVVIIFTLVGVNLLISGLHSYAGG